MKKRNPPPDYRSAVTGRFVTREYAIRHPKTTVKERNPPSRRGK